MQELGDDYEDFNINLYNSKIEVLDKIEKITKKSFIKCKKYLEKITKTK